MYKRGFPAGSIHIDSATVSGQTNDGSYFNYLALQANKAWKETSTMWIFVRSEHGLATANQA